MSVEYTLLPQERWAALREFFKGEKNAFLPHESLGVASVALNEGEIVSALVLQSVPYLGPLKTAVPFQGKIDYEKLKSSIDALYQHKQRSNLIIRGYIALPQTEEVAHLAEAHGMKRLPCPVLVQTFDENWP